MFNPDKDDYPQNECGRPEFASVIITVDSISLQAEGDDVTQKMVLSTQDALTALSKITAYFGEPNLLSQPANLQTVAQASRGPNPVYVYVTPREGVIQIITGTPTWDMLVNNESFGDSSSLLASERLQAVIAQQMGNIAQLSGGFPKLVAFNLSPDQFPDEGSASSEGGRGEDAESLVRTAEVVGEGGSDETPSTPRSHVGRGHRGTK